MRFAVAFLLLSATASNAAAASCPSDPPSASGVRLAEERWVAALEQRNSHTLGCVLDPSFADTSWRGELITKAQVMRRLPKRPASTLTLSKLEPTLIGAIAIVRGINTQIIGTKVLGSVRFVDVFVYRSGRWQAVSAQESLIQDAPTSP